jgi:DNA-binding MarR family transcriptional regulator
MDSTVPRDQAGGRRRRRLSQDVKASLRDVSIQLALLNHQVGGQVDLKATDLECLDLISRLGPLSPSALARRAGLHPATLTGILDRLERGGWIARERDPADRRGVVVRAERGRGAEILRLYLVDSGMNAALDEILAGYADPELAVVADFLRRTAAAGGAAAQRLQSTG